MLRGFQVTTAPTIRGSTQRRPGMYIKSLNTLQLMNLMSSSKERDHHGVYTGPLLLTMT